MSRVVRGACPMLPKIEFTADSSVSVPIVEDIRIKKRDPEGSLVKNKYQKPEGAEAPTYSSTAAAGFR